MGLTTLRKQSCGVFRMTITSINAVPFAAKYISTQRGASSMLSVVTRETTSGLAPSCAI